MSFTTDDLAEPGEILRRLDAASIEPDASTRAPGLFAGDGANVLRRRAEDRIRAVTDALSHARAVRPAPEGSAA